MSNLIDVKFFVASSSLDLDEQWTHIQSQFDNWVTEIALNGASAPEGKVNWFYMEIEPVGENLVGYGKREYVDQDVYEQEEMGER